MSPLSSTAHVIRLRPLTGALALAGVLTLSALPAVASVNQVTYEVAYDGTEDFNLTMTGPGFDANNRNGIVRTHDSVGYNVTISSNGADQAPTIRLTLPKSADGQPIARWEKPTQCLDVGSSLSADGQIIICRLADLTSSATQTIPFEARVLGSVRNGTVLQTPAIEVTSTKAPGGVVPPTMPQPVTVTAAPFYDVRVQMSANGSPPAFGASAESGPLPDKRDGMFHRPMVGVFARNPDGGGKKGVEQLNPASPIQIDLDLSGYPNSVRLIDWMTDATGSYRHGCGSAVPGWNQIPGAKAGERVNTFGKVTDTGPVAGTDAWTVANGGTCNVLPGTTRNTVSLSLTGVNTLLEKYPTAYSRTNAPIPRDEFWVANKALVLWTDQQDYPNNVLVNHTLRFSRIQGQSISGQNIPQPPANPDYHADNHEITSQGKGDAQKAFTPDLTLAPPRATMKDPAITSDSIVNYMAPTQSVSSVLRFGNQGSTTHTNASLCDILDRSAFDIAPHFSASIAPEHLKDANATIRYSYGAPPAGQSPYFASVDSAPSPYELIGKYSSHGSSDYSRASCNDTNIRWFDTWQQAEAAGGLVYVRAELSRIRPSSAAIFNIKGLMLRSTWASTVTVQGPQAAVRQAGQPIESGTILRNRAEITSESFPMDVTKQRDHLLVVPTRTTSRVTKVITEPASAATSPVPAGSFLTYRIQPSYSTLFPQLADTVTITDILPKGVYYVEDSSTVGGQAHEPQVQEDTPSAGMTTLTWRFPDTTPHFGNEADAGAQMAPISFRVRLSNHLTNGTLVRNLVSISGGANDYEGDCRYKAANQTWVMTRHTDNAEVVCAKGAQADVRVETPPGVRLEKQTSRTRIEPGDDFDYSIVFISMGQQISVPDMPDMIDVLPFVGDGEARPAHKFNARSPASSFDPGAYRLVSVTPPDRDKTARIYYTSRNPLEINNDPSDASNALNGGSTRWCLATELGSHGCPATIGDSTAVRISPSIRLLQANIPYNVKLSLSTDPLRSYDGNIFANHVGAKSPDASSKLHYVESQADLHVRVSLATGGLAGRVFTDIAQDNVFDPQDTGLANQCVQLRGTNSKGQQILLSMRTDQEGRYAFTPGQKQRVFDSADCSGSALPHFAGLLGGNYQLSRLGDVTALPGAIHAGSSGGTVHADQQQIADITLASGDTGSDYNFTERPVPPQLTLISTVTNTHGGSATPADVPLTATPVGQSNGITGTSGSSSITRVNVPAGEHQLLVGTPDGYRVEAWQCVVNGQPRATRNDPTLPYALNLGYGDVAVCTVALHDLPARLSLVKTVTNSNGRTARPEDFRLHADGPTPLSGLTGSAEVTDVEVLPGTYTLREDSLSGYVAGAWQCDAGTLTGNALTLGNGQHATCTINNTDQPVSLTLVLDVINEHGGTATSDDAPVSANGPASISGVSGSKSVTVAPVSPGVYLLSDPVLPGYRTGKWICSGGTLVGNRLTLGDAMNVSCRIELKDIPATLAVSKAVEGSVQPVTNSDTDYMVSYRITVRHQGGASGLYALTDLPAFDRDVQVVSVQAQRNGRPLNIQATADGSWPLAAQQSLAIGAEDVYQMQFRIRIPYGSNTDNNRCTTGTGSEGKGLFNQLSLLNQGEGAGATPLTARACVDTPVPVSRASLSIEKRGSTQRAEVGDLMDYRLRIRNNGSGPAMSPVVVDRLPAGFQLEPGSIRVQGARQTAFNQQGRLLRITLDQIGADSNNEVSISYRLRIGVGSQEGDGINRAHVECLTPNGAGTRSCSNESRWKVKVHGGIFSEEACVAGQ
ncbi:MAG: hypothetical protein Q4E06_05295, partial [Lautropia sp.]|nr:hypothetical protein [Lautropia sp.]